MDETVTTRCQVCKSPLCPEVNSRLVRGDSTEDIAAWTARLGVSLTLHPRALRRHREKHLPEARPTVPVEARTTGDLKGGDLARLTRDLVYAKAEAGILDPTLSEGLRAQEMIDRREAKTQDRDMMLALAGLLSGATVPVALAYPVPQFAIEDPYAEERADDLAMFRELAGGEVLIRPADRRRD